MQGMLCLVVKHLHLGSLSAFLKIGYKANSKLLQADVKLNITFFLFAIHSSFPTSLLSNVIGILLRY